jgi:DnaJ-class molecular chaperone
MALRKCLKCNGTGYYPPYFGDWGDKCPLCHGTGYIDDGIVEVRIRHDEKE